MLRDIALLIDRIRESWAVIQQAPGAAVFLLVAGALAAWLWERRRMSILNERLKAKDDELARYKQKLDGATPEEVKAELEGLRNALQAQEEQIQALEKKLGQVRGMAAYGMIR